MRLLIMFLLTGSSYVFPFQRTLAIDGDVAVDGEVVEIERTDHENQEKISERDLLRRYPVGKHWRSMKVLRIQGISTNKDWGLEGTQHVVYNNRYHSSVNVLSNELGDLKLRVKVIDASQERIVTKQKLRVSDFGVQSPILGLALSSAGALIMSNPKVAAALAAIKLWGRIDPNYERVLTRLLTWSDIDFIQINPNPENLKIVDDPEPLIGCTFEVVWTNGLGMTRCQQTAGPVRVKLDEIKNWGRTADPLFDYYIMDAATVNRKAGATWKVDGKQAVNVLSSQGASNAAGSLDLMYLKDSSFDSHACRHLTIQSGKLGFLLNRENRDTSVTATNIQGQILYSIADFLVLEANGTSHISGTVKSKDHLLFQAEWQSDVDVDFRYEAKVIADGRK